MPLDREPIRVCPILWLFRFWVQESAFFVGRPFQAVKKPPEKTAWKGRPTPRNGRADYGGVALSVRTYQSTPRPVACRQETTWPGYTTPTVYLWLIGGKRTSQESE